LVVIAIIAILAALLMPSLSAARERGRQIVCINNLKGIGTTIAIYANDFNDLPPPGYVVGSSGWTRSPAILSAYNGAYFYEFLYAAGYLKVVSGFGTLGGGSDSEFSAADGYREPNTSPSLLCPSGENGYWSDLNPDPGPWGSLTAKAYGRFLRAPPLRTPPGSDGTRIGFVNLSYTVNSAMGLAPYGSMRAPQDYVFLTDLYTCSGLNNMAYTSPPWFIPLIAYRYQDQGFARHSAGRSGGRMHVLYADTHVVPIYLNDVMTWTSSKLCDNNSTAWNP
jgi:prepilin-type processing-associated H-X9-DG protein